MNPAVFAFGEEQGTDAVAFPRDQSTDIHGVHELGLKGASYAAGGTQPNFSYARAVAVRPCGVLCR